MNWLEIIEAWKNVAFLTEEIEQIAAERKAICMIVNIKQSC